MHAKHTLYQLSYIPRNIFFQPKEVWIKGWMKKPELRGFEPLDVRIKNECLNHLAITPKKRVLFWKK